LLCVVAMVSSVAIVAARDAGDPKPARAAGVFDVSAWAPWWQPSSALTSFSGHSGQFGELSPFFFSAGADGTISANPAIIPTPSHPFDYLKAYRDAALGAHKPLIPTVVDATGAHVMAGILADPNARANHISNLVNFVVSGKYDGVDLDYEQFAFADGSASWPTTMPLWDAFIQELSQALHGVNKALDVSVPPIGPGIGNYPVYDYPMLGQNVDRIRIMTYSYSTGSPGPIAPFAWVGTRIDAAIAAVGAANAGKIVMGIPLYGTDWVTGVDGSCPLVVPADMKPLSRKSYQTSEFPALAQRKGVTPQWNADLHERTFTYIDSIGGPDLNGFQVRCNVSHTVYYVDPDGVYDRIALAKQKGIAGVTFWALGNDDSATWAAIDAAMAGGLNLGYAPLPPNAVAPPGPPVISPLPARFVDTRPGMKTIDGLFAGGGSRLADSTLEVQISARGAVPGNVTAVALNVTAVGEGNGFITVYPCGTRPTTSSLNVRFGQIISNSVISKLSANGSVCIYNQSQTQLIVDVFGILSSTTFVPVSSPARLLDTRPGEPTADGTMSGGGAMTPGAIIEVPVAGRANMTKSGQPAVLNVTVDGATSSGYLTVWPCGADVPKTSNLNYVAGATLANAVVTALSPNGTVCVFSSGTTHVVIDAFGELSTSRYSALGQPARLLDTRAGYTTVDGQNAADGIRSANSTYVLPVGGRAGLADQPGVAVLNVTVDSPATNGFITVYPCGGLRPNVSNVNFAAGQTLPNLVVTTVSASGTVCLYTSTRAHVVVDVFGRLAP
jgi:hypothetical protein